jgi:hypothetical protein
MNILSRVYYFLHSVFSTNSLRNMTRREIKLKNPLLFKYYIKGQLQSKLRYLVGLPGAFVFCPVAVIIASYLFTCVDYLGYIEMDRELAVETIKNGISNSSTLIGISFVVIGFLFEIAKDKTHQTFHEFFISIRLYIVLAYSLTVVAFHIVAYALLKTIQDDNIVNSLGVFSSYLMLILIIAIALLFMQLIKVYSPDAINKFSTKALLKSAKIKLIEELFISKSRDIYFMKMQSLNLKPSTFFFSLDDTERAFFTISTSDTKEIYDIKLRTINNELRKIISHTDNFIEQEAEFRPTNLSKRIVQNEVVFSLPETNYINRKVRKKIQKAFILTPPRMKEDDFITQKSNLLVRLKKATKAGDLTNVEQQLSDIEKLFELVYSNK